MRTQEVQKAFSDVQDDCAEVLASIADLDGLLRSKLSKRGARVMVCDDDENIRYIIRHSLEGLGYEVTEASNGDDCVRKIAENDIGLVLLDIGMPKLNGKQVLELIQKAKFKTIVISAQPDSELHDISLKYGVEFIRKPFRMATVIDAVKKAFSTDNQNGGFCAQ